MDGSQFPGSSFRPKTGPVPPPLPPPPPTSPPPPQAFPGSNSTTPSSSSSPLAGDACAGTQAFPTPTVAGYGRRVVPLPQRNPYPAGERAGGRAGNDAGVGQEFMAALSNMGDDDLEDLFMDDEALQLYFEELEKVKDMQTVVEELHKGNETIAQRNIARQEEMNQLKQRIAEQQVIFATLRSEFEQKLEEQSQFLKQYEPDQLLLQLKSTLLELEKKSERYADDMVSGKMDVTEFIVKFRELRKVYHLRAAKAERLATR